MIRKIVVICLALGLGFWIWQAKLVKVATAPVIEKINSVISTKDETIEHSFPPEFEKEVLNRINAFRKDKNKKPLTWSDDLTKAAKARSAVLNLFDDYSGTISGLTREKAYDLVNYETSYFGDFYFFINNPQENFLSEESGEKNKMDTILLDKFTEAGVSLAGNSNNRSYYVLFGNKKPKPKEVIVPTKTTAKVSWGGPELWTSVNNRRTQFGVGQLTRKDELCTIASIRLNQLLDLNKLDGHAGFKPVLDRSDLKWISEKYNISEFLAQGYLTPEDTVKGWENTLGHRALLTGGEYVWGCIYSQNTFSVAIAAY